MERCSSNDKVLTTKKIKAFSSLSSTINLLKEKTKPLTSTDNNCLLIEKTVFKIAVIWSIVLCTMPTYEALFVYPYPGSLKESVNGTLMRVSLILPAIFLMFLWIHDAPHTPNAIHSRLQKIAKKLEELEGSYLTDLEKSKLPQMLKFIRDLDLENYCEDKEHPQYLESILYRSSIEKNLEILLQS